MDYEFYRQKWYEIHSKAAEVNRGERSHRSFCNWMRNVPNDLPCSICSGHARDYMRKYPPEKYHDMFYWAWKFHNEVNNRKSKPLVSYDDARRRYRV